MYIRCISNPKRKIERVETYKNRSNLNLFGIFWGVAKVRAWTLHLCYDFLSISKYVFFISICVKYGFDMIIDIINPLQELGRYIVSKLCRKNRIQTAKESGKNRYISRTDQKHGNVDKCWKNMDVPTVVGQDPRSC